MVSTHDKYAIPSAVSRPLAMAYLGGSTPAGNRALKGVSLDAKIYGNVSVVELTTAAYIRSPKCDAGEWCQFVK